MLFLSFVFIFFVSLPFHYISFLSVHQFGKGGSDYPNLIGLFLTRDIPPTPKAAFKTYSDAELKRLNREIVKLDAQTARLMIIHQMLGTRISDTLTLTPDCLSERNGEIIIRIRQMKTKPYEKPISAELAALIKKAIAYTKEKYGDTTYIFVDEKNPSRPMPYTTVQFRITDMIYKKELRDDNGEIFGFGTHIYRHYYGMKLTEMHLDDWTIAKLLGHSSVRNVKYYRKMSNQLLADETRKARQRLSAVILDNLDGWEAEYEQIRQALRKAEDKESFIEYLEREGYQVRWSANRKHITFITPEGYRCRDSSLHDETFLKDNLEYLFLYRQLTNFQLGGEEPLYGWLYGVTYNAEALTRYLEQAMDVPEPPPIPVWTESKQRQREALKKLAHGQRLENIESFEEDEGYDFGMSM